jgi:hypothetical protein
VSWRREWFLQIVRGEEDLGNKSQQRVRDLVVARCTFVAVNPVRNMHKSRTDSDR